ncbi:MAG: gamma-glutamylcyclotransferase [Terriglobia bacterium]
MLRDSVPGGRAKELHRLFVYGTLRCGCDLHHHLTRLGARFIAEAKVSAELLPRGRYPGARPACQSGKWVRGEVYRLRQPARDLRVLDKVEGFVAEALRRSEFVRARAEVLLNGGARQQAWIYWLGARKSTGGSYG